MRVLACADKFRGTLDSVAFGAAVEEGAAGHEVTVQPMADGGEGTLDAFGGENRTTLVTGPLGTIVEAGWSLSRGRAVIEMAAASGLVLAGGAEGNDPMTATTAGTGELIARAVEGGAETIIVGLGGSATTDGGLGALRALPATSRLRGVDLVVACERPEVRAMLEQGDGRLPRRQTLWVPRPVGEGKRRKALYRIRSVQRLLKAAGRDGQGAVERIVGVGAALEMLAAKPR